MQHFLKPSLLALSVLTLVGCSSTFKDQRYQVAEAKLANGERYSAEPSDDVVVQQEQVNQRGYKELQPFSNQRLSLKQVRELADNFPSSNSLTFSADKMPGEQFLHSVFGELLGVSYVIAEGTPNLELPVTLNLQKQVSSRALFLLVADILNQREIAITLKDQVYFIHARDPDSKASTSVGFGRQINDVPAIQGEVVQIVPIRFGMSSGLERTLAEISNAKITPDLQQNAIYVRGTREEVLRVLDLINLFDTPASRGRSIGLLYLTYLAPDEFTKQAGILLESEGLSADVDRAGRNNMAMINLDQIGAVALFASDPLYIERARFWASQLDQPSKGVEKRYFVFHPRFARAADLGQSVASLLGQAVGTNRVGSQARDTRSSGITTQSGNQANQMQQRPAAAAGGAVTVNTESVRMTVDERSNTIIFYSTGKEYQSLLPMIRRLDVMPKQILLEATIAEVTMEDDFALGFEYAVTNGKFSSNTSTFKAGEIGGLNLSYINGLDKVVANMRQTDSKINVLSNPSIVVRDGVQASMSVGNDIPTLGATSTNPNTGAETVAVVYRKTGVNLAVTPTINAQGLVVMQIEQSISNTAQKGSSISGSPAIYERNISTEVIAQSGQTILLAGLISDNSSENETKVPFFGDLPLLGNLFRTQGKTGQKTELVILITPKVIDRPEHWNNIRNRLTEGLNFLAIDVEKNSD